MDELEEHKIATWRGKFIITEYMCSTGSGFQYQRMEGQGPEEI